MSIDAKTATKLGELKKQLEDITGEEVQATPDQLAIFSFPVGAAFYEDTAQVLFRRIIFPGKFCQSPVRLLDASGRIATGANGTVTFLLSSFICSSLNSFAEPVNVLATPKAASPCFLTLTHELVKDPNNPNFFNDVRINAFAWDANGAAAPNIAFDWRCRVVSHTIIL